MGEWLYLYGVQYSFFGGSSGYGRTIGLYAYTLTIAINNYAWDIGSTLVEYHIHGLVRIPVIIHVVVYIHVLQPILFLRLSGMLASHMWSILCNTFWGICHEFTLRSISVRFESCCDILRLGCWRLFMWSNLCNI